MEGRGKGSAPVSGWTVGAVVWRRRRRGALWAAFGRRAARCAPLRSRAGGAEARARPRAGGTRRSGVDVGGGGPWGRAVPLARLPLSRYLARPGAEV